MRFWRVSFAIFVALLSIACMNRFAWAATDVAQGLQISPVIIELNGDKGKTYNLKISVLNVTTGDLVFKPSVNDFKSKDETGTPEVLLNSDLPLSASITKWISPIDDLALGSKQTKSLDINVNIPDNAEAGGHYGVIRFTGTAPQLQDTGVSQKASVGVLVLVRVSGDITEKLDLKEFFAMKNGKQSSWFENGPVSFAERIENTGNVHVKPQGDVVIKDMFGKTTGKLKVNDTKGNVLPKSVRRFDQTLSSKRLFGKYTASVDLAYGSGGQVLTGKMSFWIIPYKLIALVLLGLIIIILLIIRLIKKYNRWIISKSGHRPGTSSSNRSTSNTAQHDPSFTPRPPKPPESPPRPPLVQ